MPQAPATKEELIEFCSNPELVNYVCLVNRIGLAGWMVELEHTRFKPDTWANDGFHLAFIKWPEKDPIPSLMLALISIDKSGEKFADELLWNHGLKKCSSELELMLIGPAGTEQFWLSGPNVFYLENHSKGAPHVMYSNNPTKIDAAWKHEKTLIQRFYDEHAAWLETPEGKASFDDYWKDKPEGYCR